MSQIEEGNQRDDVPWAFPVTPTMSNGQDIDRADMYGEEVKTFDWKKEHGCCPQREVRCTKRQNCITEQQLVRNYCLLPFEVDYLNESMKTRYKRRSPEPVGIGLHSMRNEDVYSHGFPLLCGTS